MNYIENKLLHEYTKLDNTDLLQTHTRAATLNSDRSREQYWSKCDWYILWIINMKKKWYWKSAHKIKNKYCIVFVLLLITFKLIEIVVVARGGGGSQELFSTNFVNYLSLFITKYTFIPYKEVTSRIETCRELSLLVDTPCWKTNIKERKHAKSKKVEGHNLIAWKSFRT